MTSVVFGLVGYFMRRFEFNAAAFLISFVLAPGAEEALRQSMRMSGDDPAIFIERPLALLLFAIALLGLGSRVYGQVKRRRRGAPVPTRGEGPVVARCPTNAIVADAAIQYIP